MFVSVSVLIFLLSLVHNVNGSEEYQQHEIIFVRGSDLNQLCDVKVLLEKKIDASNSTKTDAFEEAHLEIDTWIRSQYKGEILTFKSGLKAIYSLKEQDRRITLNRVMSVESIFVYPSDRIYCFTEEKLPGVKCLIETCELELFQKYPSFKIGLWVGGLCSFEDKEEPVDFSTFSLDGPSRKESPCSDKKTLEELSLDQDELNLVLLMCVFVLVAIIYITSLRRKMYKTLIQGNLNEKAIDIESAAAVRRRNPMRY